MPKFPWITRFYDRSVSLEVKLPIDAQSRAFVDGEIEALRGAVIPICGEDSHLRPCLLGSGILVSYRGETILLTAAHVLTDNANVPLFVFGKGGEAHWLDSGFWLEAASDLAAMRLSIKDLAMLSLIKPLSESTVATGGFSGGKFYGSVVGYPASSTKRPEKNALHTPIEVYSNFGSEMMGDKVSILFDWKEGAFNDVKGHNKARKPTGKSGGAILGFPVSGRSVLLGMKPQLVGVSSRWKREENRIEGSGHSSIRRILEKATTSDP